jgi:hypothetical protein
LTVDGQTIKVKDPKSKTEYNNIAGLLTPIISTQNNLKSGQYMVDRTLDMARRKVTKDSKEWREFAQEVKDNGDIVMMSAMQLRQQAGTLKGLADELAGADIITKNSEEYKSLQDGYIPTKLTRIGSLITGSNIDKYLKIISNAVNFAKARQTQVLGATSPAGVFVPKPKTPEKPSATKSAKGRSL